MRSSRIAAAVSAGYIAIILLFASPAHAQLQATWWIFREGDAVHFPGGDSPVSIPVVRPTGGGQWYVSLADPVTGDLDFYTDFKHVWNREHQYMQGDETPFYYGRSDPPMGVGLRSLSGDGVYYLVYAAVWMRFAPLWQRHGVFVRRIDMGLDGGRGAIVSPDIQLSDDSVSGVVAIRKCGSDGFWVIALDICSDGILEWSFDRGGFAGPRRFRSGCDLRCDDDRRLVFGRIGVSPDGRRLAISNGWQDSTVDLFDFNPATGDIAERASLRLWVPQVPLWPTFSPDGSKLYVGSGSRSAAILQYDLAAGDSLAVARSQWQVTPMRGNYLDMQLGPNGVLYINHDDVAVGWLSLIRYPERPGAACGYRGYALRLSDTFAGGPRSFLPTFVNNDLGLRYIANGRQDTVCRGEPVTLHGRWVHRPRWIPSAFLSCDTCLEPVATPDTSITYRLYHDGAPSCGEPDSVRIVVLPRPAPSVRGDTLLCPGEGTTLEILGGDTARWRPADGLSCTDCRRMTVYPRTSTTYYFDVTNANGCTITDSVHVRIAPLPTPHAGADTTICLGASVPLHASGGVRYHWEPATGLSCTDCADPLARPLQATIYRLTAWNEAGCSATASVQVRVGEPIVVDAGTDRRVCGGGAVQLGATGAASYRWDATADLSCLECPDPVARPVRTTTYGVVGTSAEGCSVRDSVTVVVDGPPHLVLSGDSLVCAGDSAVLEVSGAASYRWRSTMGEPSCPDCPVQRERLDRTSTFWVEGTSADGCTALDSFTVRVAAPPRLVLSGGGSICRGESVVLHASGASTYRWEPATGLSCSDCPDPVATPLESTDYRVTGISAEGCSATATLPVEVSGPQRVHLWLARNVHLLPGATVRMPIMLGEDLRADTLDLALGWNPHVVRVTDFALPAALDAAGWQMQIVGAADGTVRLRLRHAGAVAIAAGNILEATITAFLGDSTATELALQAGTSSRCVALETRAGQVVLDSICGMSFRLMDFSGMLLQLDRPVPNPAGGTVAFGFALPYDGAAALELLDAAGQVRTIWQGTAAGEHQLELRTGALAAGVYEIRLRFGDQTRSQRMVVVR